MVKKETNYNPFLEISHRGDEKVIMNTQSTKKIKNLSKELTKNNIILFIVGEPGSGKTLSEKEIEKSLPKRLEKKKIIFSSDLINELKYLSSKKTLKKKTIMFIDKFELSDIIKDEKLKKIINLIINTSKIGIGYVITCTPSTLVRLFSLSDKIKSYSKVYSVPALSLEQAKKLIISRLNIIRKKKINSVDPFTTSQIKNIWKTSKGNPRMILLLCASLYEILK